MCGGCAGVRAGACVRSRGCVCTRVRAFVHAGVRCLQYTIILFDTGDDNKILFYISYKSHTLMISPQRVPG